MPRLSTFWAIIWSAVFVIQQAVFIAHAAPDDWKSAYAPEDDGWRKIPQHFIFNNGTEPETLDPARMTGVPESRLAEALFEGLVALDPETLAPRPAVAESWTISDDGLVYRFTLRANAKWSNGDMVTATDFYRSWERVLAPKTAAEYAYQLYPVAGAEAFNKGKIADFAKVGIKAVDARTLEVKLHAPCSYFLDLAAFHTLYPVPVSLIAEHGERWVRPEHFVGNGPYRLQTWEPRQRLVMVKNPHYWDHAFCKLESITALPYDDLDTAYKLFLGGKIHWMPAIPLPKLDEVKRNADFYVSQYLGTYFYRFNVTKAPFNDPRVRKALSLAVDRSVITEHVLRGGQKAATWFCPEVGGYKPIKGLAYNRDAARKLLAEAGYGDKKPFPTIELLYNKSDAHKQVAEAIAQQWKQNLGITASLRNSEWKVFLADMNKLNYQIARSGWIGDYGDPNTFFDMWVTGGGNNRTGWSNSTYDKLLKESQLTLDREKRFNLFQQMEKILVEDEFPFMPIYIYVNQGLLRESVAGWYENIRDIHPVKYLWLEPIE